MSILVHLVRLAREPVVLAREIVVLAGSSESRGHRGGEHFYRPQHLAPRRGKGMR